MNPLIMRIRRGSGPKLYLDRLHFISLNVDDDKFISGEREECLINGRGRRGWENYNEK